jgi:rhodanese-related sulfurtransferase
MTTIRAIVEWLFAGIEVNDAKERQEKGALLIDVREPGEWTAGHASGARHIPLGQLDKHLAGLPRDRELLFICQSGMRSARAVARARAAGLDKARNVKGGLSAWQRAGLPLNGGRYAG